MIIDGRIIASSIKDSLKEKIAALRSQSIIPHLAVILVGNDPGSQTYVKQKQKIGEELGIKISLFNIDSAKNTPGVASKLGFPRGEGIKKELINIVQKLNSDPLVHGIIIQRPVPLDISKEELNLLVIPQKDVDGFHPKTQFTPPIALAVLKILEYIFVTAKSQMHAIASICYQRENTLLLWLKNKRILVIGRGETAGKPIAETLQKMGLKIVIAHSKTTQLDQLVKLADIVITCVGRANIVRRNMVSDKTVLIGVGLHRENGKLKTDYNQVEVANKVAFYTPVPGGVGPVNVACLFENLILAAKSLK